MTIVLNGRPHDAPQGGTVQALLEAIGFSSGRVAVEVNGGVVRKGDHSKVALREGDRVEVIQLVGGG